MFTELPEPYTLKDIKSFLSLIIDDLFAKNRLEFKQASFFRGKEIKTKTDNKFSKPFEISKK